MNIFVVTENNFFFIGLQAKLYVDNMKIQKLLPDELEKKSREEFKHDDIFIIHSSCFGVELSFQISTGGLPGKLIFIPMTNKEKFKLAFNHYVVLNTYATIDDISAWIINSKENGDMRCHVISKPLTNREKTIMRHIIDGMNVQKIGQCLSITTKTVYAHRRRAFHKLGGRNLFDIWPFRGKFLHTSMI